MGKKYIMTKLGKVSPDEELVRLEEYTEDCPASEQEEKKIDGIGQGVHITLNDSDRKRLNICHASECDGEECIRTHYHCRKEDRKIFEKRRNCSSH